MKRSLSLALAFLLVSSSAWAAGPLASAVARLGQQLPVPVQPNDLERKGNNAGVLIGVGAAMLGVGVTLEILANTAMKNEVGGCIIGFYGDYACAYETSSNKPLLFIGMGVGVTGGFLMDYGFRQRRKTPELTFVPGGIAVVQRIALPHRR